MPLQIHVHEADGSTAGILRRDLDGRITRQ
jgi:hypothetical protein